MYVFESLHLTSNNAKIYVVGQWNVPAGITWRLLATRTSRAMPHLYTREDTSTASCKKAYS